MITRMPSFLLNTVLAMPGEAVVPEAAVAHHRHGALAEHRMHRGVRGEAEAVAEHRVADVERRQRREQVAADVRREVELAAFLRALSSPRTPAAPGSRRRTPAAARAAGEQVGRGFSGERIGVRALLVEKPRIPVSTTSPVYSPASGSTSLPRTFTPLTPAGAGREHRVLDVGRLAFFDDEDRFLVLRESGDLVRDQRVGHVHAVDRHARGAEGVGQAERLQRADHRVVQAALADDAELLVLPGKARSAFAP